MGIKLRIWALPAIASLTFAISIGVILTVSNQTYDHIQGMGDDAYPHLAHAKQALVTLDPITVAFQAAVSESEPKRIEDAKRMADELRQTVARISKLKGRQQAADRIRKACDDYLATAEQTAMILLGKSAGDPTVSVAAMQDQLKQLRDLLENEALLAQQDFDAMLQQSQRGVQSVSQVTLISAALVIAGLVAASWRIIASIWGQLGAEPVDVRLAMDEIAAGDLSRRIEVDASAGANLLRSIASMSDGLRDMVEQVRDGAGEIAHAAQEIAAGNLDLSRRTEMQAGAVEITTQSMQLLTESVRANAASARQASSSAARACADADTGGVAIRDAIASMNEISQSAQKISEITGVIDAIAFQTNILALNASIEAARAGEHGRGFAVVAGEVRRLAHRAADAAKEIAALIEVSTQHVGEGTDKVNRAGAAMNNALQSVHSAAALIDGIAIASDEQAEQITEASVAIAGIDDSTRQNSALVEEAAAAAASLQSQTQRLADLTQRFKTERMPV